MVGLTYLEPEVRVGLAYLEPEARVGLAYLEPEVRVGLAGSHHGLEEVHPPLGVHSNSKVFFIGKLV